MAKRSSFFSKKYLMRQHRKVWRFKDHPFVVPVFILLGLLGIAGLAYIFGGGQSLRPSDAHVVIVSYDKKQQTVPTRAANVGDLLKRLHVAVREGDVVEPSQDTPIVEDNFRVNVYRARPVTIIDQGHKTLAFNAAATPRSIAGQAGISVFPEDSISAEPVENIVNDGIAEKVVIDRATLANINLYGTPVAIRSHAKTVGELLQQKHVELAKDDTVTPALITPLTSGLLVFVTRNGTQIVTEEEVIAAEVQTIEDGSLSFGTTAVRQDGSAGKKLVTYQLDLQNGKEVSRNLIQSVIAVEPVKRIVARGKAISIPEDKSGLMSTAGIAASDYAYVNYIVSRESGWCSTKWQGQVGYCPAYYQDVHPVTSGFGFGLCQSTPAGKMASAGADWQTNPVTQLRWCSGYATGRYGSWAAAYDHWVVYHNW